jgi:hypothetical protein
MINRQERKGRQADEIPKAFLGELGVLGGLINPYLHEEVTNSASSASSC